MGQDRWVDWMCSPLQQIEQSCAACFRQSILARYRRRRHLRSYIHSCAQNYATWKNSVFWYFLVPAIFFDLKVNLLNLLEYLIECTIYFNSHVLYVIANQLSKLYNGKVENFVDRKTRAFRKIEISS